MTPELEATRKDFLQVRQEGVRTVGRPVSRHALDAVLPVGYLVRSASATQFRRWASEVLCRYTMNGSATNERCLKEFGVLTDILATSHDENLSGLSDVMRRYTQDFDLLSSYDRGTFDETAGTTPTWALNLSASRKAIAIVRSQFQNDELFGAERGDGFSTVLDQIEQSSFGQPLYPTVEGRAVHLIRFPTETSAAPSPSRHSLLSPRHPAQSRRTRSSVSCVPSLPRTSSRPVRPVHDSYAGGRGYQPPARSLCLPRAPHRPDISSAPRPWLSAASAKSNPQPCPMSTGQPIG